MEKSPLQRMPDGNEARSAGQRKETGPAKVNKARLPGGLEDPFDLSYRRETGLDTPLPLGRVKPGSLNNENADRLEMTDRDSIPTREDLSHILNEEPTRQQRRAEVRQTEKKSRRTEKKATPPPLPASGIKKAYGFYPSGSLNEVIAKIDDIEAKILDLEDGHANLASNTRATEEELRAELEFLKEGLGKTVGTEEKKENARTEAIPSTDEELPNLQFNEDGRLTEREPGFVEPTKNKTPFKKEVKEANVDLERLADKYGIILSPEGRAQRLHDSNKVLKDHASELPEAIRLEQLLTDDEETLRTTTDITDSNKKSLTARIRETKKKLAPFSEVLEARNERETLLKYPTAAEEVGFNLEETVQEMARTKKTNVIRLQELRNTFADLQRMEGLMGAVETTKKPLPLPRKNRAERSITETEQLAEQLGITLDPREREAEIATLQGEVRDLQNKFNKVDDEITSLQGKLAKTNIIKVQERLTQQIHALEEQREQIRNRYNNAGDRYSEALASPATAQEEIDNRLNELDDRLSASKDLNPIMEEMRELEQLKALLPPPLSEKETQPQDLGLDYAYEPSQEEKPASAEVDLDEENLVDVVEPEEATFQWTPSSERKLREEEAKFRAPREERNLPPRVLPGQTRESLVERVREIDKMLKTRAVDGKTMSSQRRQQLARGRDALARRLETVSDISATEAEGENDHRRASGIRETMLPFPTSGSSDPEILEQDRLIAEHEAAKTEQAQTRERNAQVYRARAQEYKKELHWIANALAERGEFVEIPGQTRLAAEPEKKPWYSSAWTKIREATFRRDIAKLKQHFKATLGYYEEAEQTARAVERGLQPLKKARAGMGGLAESSERLNERLNDQIHFEKTLDDYKHMREKARDVSNYLLTGKSPDGRTLTPEYKENLRTALVKEMITLQEGTTIAERKALEKIMRDIDEIYLPVTKFTRSNVGALQMLELDQDAREPLENIGKTSLRHLQTLEARASVGKTRDERKEAQEDLEALKRDIGGKTIQEINTKILHSLEAATQLASLDIEPTSKQKLVHSYKERLRSIEENLGLKGEAKTALKKIQKNLTTTA